jgi:hypothetical protein
MGITPITNLAPLPLTRAIAKELEPLPMERVDNTARTGDETYSPSNQSSARGAEDDGAEDGPEDNGPEDDGPEEEFQNLAGEDDAQPSPEPAAEPSTQRISFLA